MLENTVFFRSESNVKMIPQSMAEVILSGRSNVGKSSVINTLCSKKKLARTSKTPGRTRTINIYSTAVKKWIIDLPGYGFAKVRHQEKRIWNAVIEDYIILRRSRKRVYIIIDAFVGPTDLDFNMAEWLAGHNISFKIVANKCDKLPGYVPQCEVEDEAARCFGIEKSNVFAVSAKNKSGFCALRSDIGGFFNF
ncbi:MAG: ribosome biogenesis GTP-binding protein YihA/YsxC [Endomicrobium sp.]|jgi:GTP-binding protein|nr:ribosome biogenesis GTP-binding protein YihA/YsxC [Endomicrobium sp.]